MCPHPLSGRQAERPVKSSSAVIKTSSHIIGKTMTEESTQEQRREPMKILRLKSPGKINLRLDVIGKRSDGYHDLCMINSLVNVYDDIEITFIERGLIVECSNDSNVPDGENNIVYKAAKEILAYSNKNIGVHIKINKCIPSSAGMGGGSSNAACVLMGLNEFLKINLSKEKLMKIGVKFGADVPFFILQAPAIARGIGELLTKVKKMPKLPLVLVTPNIKVPTKWVFENYKASNDNVAKKSTAKNATKDEIPVEFATKKSVIKYLNNDLERVTVEKYPVLNDVKASLKKMGALATQMTGSGPTVFGIFADKDAAMNAVEKMKAKLPHYHVFHAENI
jgi:4-diphosphocytidyl-2-C-methyl-D-erythritol kinase